MRRASRQVPARRAVAATRPIVVLLVAGVLFAAIAARAAETFEAPSHWLRKADRIVVRVEPLGPREPSRYEFRVLEALSGEAPETVTVRLDEATRRAIDPEERYFLGYTELLRDRRDERYYRDPEGPNLLEIPWVGPALTLESPALERLLEPIVPDSSADALERLDAIAAQLERSDPIGRRWVLADLVLYPQTSDVMTPEHAAALERAFAGAEEDPRSREYVLRILWRQAERLGHEWLLTAARTVVEAQPTELEPGTDVPSLTTTALEILRQSGETSDGELAAKHVHSSNPAVAREAMRTWAELAPESAAEAVPMLLWNDELSRDARQVAVEFLRRRLAGTDG